MSAVTIIVEFETVAGAGTEFARIISEHARRTLHEEPGCLRFEVVRPVDEHGRPKADQIVVNELYADQAAVEAHRDNPRMATLGAVIKPLLKSRRRIEAHAMDKQPFEEGIRPENLSAANDD